MAYHPNGRGPYGQAHAYPQSQPPYTPYGAQPQGYDHITRTPSFDAGDDHTYLDNERSGDQHIRQGSEYPAYSAGDQTAPYHQSTGGYQHAMPMRQASYRPGEPNLQPQYRPNASSPEPAAYNPQQFPQPQSRPVQYTAAQSPTPTQTTFNYQAYNPAAYHTTEVHRQSSHSTSAYSSPSMYSRPGSSSQPPPPPPRPGASYSAHVTPVIGSFSSSQSPTPSHLGSTPLPPRPSAYSPPAPLPPRHDTSASNASYRQRHHAQNTGHEPYGSSFHTLSGDYPSPPSYEPVHSAASYGNRNESVSSHASSPQFAAPLSTSSSGFAHSPQRTDTLTRHPQSRPLPGPPPESDSDSDYFAIHNVSRPPPASNVGVEVPEMTYEDLMKEIETAVMDRSSSRARASGQPPIQTTHTSSAQQQTGTGLYALSNSTDLTPDERHTHTNGQLEATGSGQYINYGAFSDDSDAEAAAGLAAMQAADQEDEVAAERARRRSGGNGSIYDAYGSPGPTTTDNYGPVEYSSSESGYNVDMSLMGGGYDAHLRYDDNARRVSDTGYGLSPTSEYGSLRPRMDSVSRSDQSTEGRTSQADSWVPMPTPDFTRPLPPIDPDVARGDVAGTGGLTEPSPHPRRLSFDDGDEAALLDSESGRPLPSQSPSKETIQDLFYHPGMSIHRPLPPAPDEPQPLLPHLVPAGTYRNNDLPPLPGDVRQIYPASADTYDVPNPSAVPRSTSFVSTRSTPKIDQPLRSKTDADKAKLQKQMTAGRDSSYDTPSTTIGYDLPVLKKNFVPEKITSQQFRKCSQPWALSSVVQWLRQLVADADYLKEAALIHAVVLLFSFKVPTMNTTEAEKLGAKVIKDMLNANALVKEEEWVKLGNGELSGVLFQLTGTGCYSSQVHVTEGTGKCYSHYCMRTWKRIDLSIQMPLERKTEDWVTFYKLKKEDLEGKDKKEIERQNILHEVITTEDGYIEQLDVLRLLYRDQLKTIQPPIIPAKRSATFLVEVFGSVDEVKRVNENYLLGQLKYRQQEQGPWIVGFSDIFREWIRKAKNAYISYASGFPRANYLVRCEAYRNIAFRQFLDAAREDKRSNRLAWDTYLKGPITRLQRYGLLLQTVHKNMKGDSEEKLNLQFAIDEIRAVTFECNSKVDEMTKKIELLELESKIRLRKGMENVKLNLGHLGREIIIQGNLLRPGGRGLQWVETRAILFDHYLVLAKVVSLKDSAGALKDDYFDVSRVPIPMDLIVLESMDDDPVVKSSVKGIGAVTTSVTPRPQLGSSGTGGGRTNPAPGAPQNSATHTNTINSSGNSGTSIPSGKSMVTTTIIDQPSKDEKVLYPFRVKHLGKSEAYTLYAFSASSRQEWCEAIISAKTRHATALQAQNAEPFKLKVLADTAFGYDSTVYSPPRPIIIRGTPLDRAIREAEQKYSGQPRPPPVCRAAVNCAVVFNQPYGRLVCAVGTDYGVYVSEYDNPRGWARSIHMSRVTQATVLEEFSIFLLIADKSLIAYPLDTACSQSTTLVPKADTSARRAPQKLSGTREVGFFATGKMKDRALVFYKKKDGLSSTFKVLEPVLQKSATSRSRFLPTSSRRGHTDFFREYDEFYIPAECYFLNLFHSSLAISTSRGVEVLTLDKKVPFSVPILRADQPDAQASLSSIANRIKDLKPLGMFRLSEAEFLVVFEECAVYVNKHGDVSRSVLLEFVGRAKSACLYGQYLILFNDDFVEIRNSMNGRLKQVIAGRDIKCLDDGGGNNGNGIGVGGPPSLGGGLNGLGVQGFGAAPKSVKFCMQHPEYERSQVIVELVENDSRHE